MRFKDFERIVFFTGAGMSAESGVPTYRGAGGIWREYDYRAYACQDAFNHDPEHVWEFHNYRRGIVGACAPNRGHEIIAELEATHHVTVVTQNIDGLHQLAGSTNVIELHGSLWRLRCDHCGNRHRGRENPLEELHCTACHSYWRPDIVWFGDTLNFENIQDAQHALQECDLMISIGTSGVVYPAAALPMVAKRSGARMVEVNPELTDMSVLYDVNFRTTASEALTEMSGA
ncbi:MAG: NAD-dependent deacylase [Deltaproteobacteria bacterium]|nr:NAD-dependent deacylase [Deltaproteobacteria bacterium]